MIAKNETDRIYFIKFIIILLIFFFVVFIFLCNYFIEEEKKINDKIYPNIFLDNINIANKTKQEIRNFYAKKIGNLNNIKFIILYKDISIATLSAEAINLHTNVNEIIDKAYLVGRTTQTTLRIYQKIISLLGLGRFTFYSHLSYDRTVLNDFINSLEEQYNKPAKNALFSFDKGRVINFRQEENGLKINSNQFLADFDTSFRDFLNKLEDKKIILTDQVIEPEITLVKANQFGIEEFIGEGKSDFSHSIIERVDNIILASSKFNGVLIPTDKIFSFNETVGDISSLSGYKPAYIIKSGKTVLGDGGGVCQVSTTLFRAALNTGLPIIERYPHAYRVSYYENDAKPGLDATVYAPSIDLKIKNNTPAYILIQTEIDKEKNLLFFRFYGKRDNRKVELSPIVVFDVKPPLPPLYQDDPTAKKGTIKQVDFPAWGGKSVFDYKVYDDSKINLLFEKKFFSVYKPWQAVYLVGTSD